ncbi:hypothetical protein F5887DRAFT_1074724 [Amanita rubescens]|nr:hypothetical protein F5887DRAFT_1074724 [Amanita rubescens]
MSHAQHIHIRYAIPSNVYKQTRYDVDSAVASFLLNFWFTAAKEKRREEKGVKLLKAAEKQLDQELARPVEAVRTMAKNVSVTLHANIIWKKS